ncbi:MAG TPA: hypothetical protein VMF10_16680 [Candidatus Aquilonibacter sp.]|nr:hypothetical protein [Candidatus Aquilonibacter sp.]
MKRIMGFGSLFASTLVIGSFAIGSFPFISPLSAQNSQSSPALTQNVAPAQEQPLGDVARKIHKNADPSKAQPKVFDNDNLPTADKISVVGQPSDAANTVADSTVKPDATSSKPAAEDDQAKKQAEWKSWQGKVSTQKQQIDLSTRELDVLQREYQLRAAEMYADAGSRLRNSAQWDKQDADYKQQLADKQKSLDDAKQKLQDMQEQGRKAGVPSSMLE